MRCRAVPPEPGDGAARPVCVFVYSPLTAAFTSDDPGSQTGCLLAEPRDHPHTRRPTTTTHQPDTHRLQRPTCTATTLRTSAADRRGSPRRHEKRLIRRRAAALCAATCGERLKLKHVASAGCPARTAGLAGLAASRARYTFMTRTFTGGGWEVGGGREGGRKS